MALVGVDKDPIGSVGQLTAAALETAGHYMQSVMLDALDAGLGSSLGVFLFTLAAVGAVLVIALGGQYKALRWFVFGPIAFIALVNIRTPSFGAVWQFGDRRYPGVVVDRATRGITAEDPLAIGAPVTDDGKPVEVAAAFALWNRITSSFIRGIVSVMNLTKDNSDLQFISQVERFEALFMAQIPDARIRAFVNLAAVNNCADYYVLMRDYYDPSTNDVRRLYLKEVIELRGQKPAMTSKDLPELFAWLDELGILAESEDILGTDRSLAADLTCDDLWALAIRAVRRNTPAFIDAIADNIRSPGLSKAEALERLKEKFDVNLIKWNGYKDSIDDNQRVIYMTNQVAARMVLHEFRKVNPNLAELTVDRYLPVEKQSRQEYAEYMSQALRDMQKTEADVGKGDFLTAMLALPNIQGFLLYWLAVGFPFFALSLVVPGRFGAIFVWMGLWLWVKSWDVGFAVVMVIDKLLFGLMPNAIPLDNDVVVKPGLAIKAMLESDPSYNAHIYYNIVATLLAAVPLVTGLVVRRGGKEVVSYVGDRFTTFSGRIGYAMASHSRSLLAQSFAARAHRNIDLATDRALWRSVQDKDVTDALGIRGLNRLSGSIAGQGGYLANLASALSGAPAEQRGMIASAKTVANVNEAAYSESMMPHNLRYAQRAIFQTYYNHDFVLGYPGSEKAEVIKAFHYLPWGGIMQNVIGGALSSPLRIGAAVGGSILLQQQENNSSKKTDTGGTRPRN